MEGLISFIIGIPLLILRGFVLSSIWLWYLVPGLNVDPISVFTGIGIAFIVNLLTIHITLGQASILVHMGIKTKPGIQLMLMALNTTGTLMLWLIAWIFYVV